MTGHASRKYRANKEISADSGVTQVQCDAQRGSEKRAPTNSHRQLSIPVKHKVSDDRAGKRSDHQSERWDEPHAEKHAGKTTEDCRSRFPKTISECWYQMVRYRNTGCNNSHRDEKRDIRIAACRRTCQHERQKNEWRARKYECDGGDGTRRKRQRTEYDHESLHGLNIRTAVVERNRPKCYALRLVKSLVGRVFGIVLLGLAGPASAQTPWSAGETSGSALIIKLVTIGPGVPLYAWWGHSGMIVEDRRTGISRFYDYGRFSFKQDHFYRNFAVGRLYFEIGSAPTDAYLEHYRSLDQTVRIQTLDLSPENALELAKLLDHDVLPGNNIYLYDHYYDNCATRLRDILDQFTDGALKLGADEDSGIEFRTETRRFTQHSFFFDFLLTYLMSDSIDAEMSEWETMFLPERLEQQVASLRIRDGRGGTRPIVTESVLFHQSREGRTIADLPDGLHRSALFAAAIFGVLALLGIGLYESGGHTGRIILGLHLSITGLVAGALGTTLFFMSIFTDHVVTYGNENLIYTNPLSFVLLVAGVRLLLRRSGALLFSVLSAGAFALATGLLAISKLVVPTLDQQNWPQIALFGAVYLVELLTVTILHMRHVMNQKEATSEA